MDSVPPSSVLFIAYEAPQIEMFLEVAKALRLGGSLVPILYCPYALPKSENYQQLCAQNGIEYLQEHTALGGRTDLMAKLQVMSLRYSGPVAQVDATIHDDIFLCPKGLGGYAYDFNAISKCVSKARRNREKTKLLLRQWRISLPQDQYQEAVRKFQFWLRTYQWKLKLARAVVERLRVAAIILAEHIAERDSVVWQRVASESGIATVVLAQHTISRSATVQAYARNPEYCAGEPVNAIFLQYFPQWENNTRGHCLIRLPAPQALAQEWWGMAMPNPWVANADDGLSIWVESRFLADLYIQEGVPAQAISVVGSPQLDKLARILRPPIYGEKSDILSAIDVDISKPLVVCALPSNLYPQRQAGNWDTYEELICDYLEKIRRLKHVSYVCALHPSVEDKYEELLKKWAIPSVRGRLWEILPHAKVYITSMSSTIAWALACGIPVINYDAYGLDYKFGTEEHGVYNVKAPEVFGEILREIDDHFASTLRSGMSAKLVRLTKQARRHAEYYGRLDGRCLERILAGIYGLVRQRLPTPRSMKFWDWEMCECEQLLNMSL